MRPLTELQGTLDRAKYGPRILCKEAKKCRPQPYHKGSPGTPTSFETYFRTSVGKGYAIFPGDVNRLLPGSKVVLLRKVKDKRRAEGVLVSLVPTGKTPQGIQRYDVYFQQQTVVPNKKPVEKLNHFGVAVL